MKTDIEFVSGESNCKVVNGVKKVKLTPREEEVLQLMALGKSNTEIAKIMTVSKHTVKAHVGHILAKFEVHDRTLAIIKAMRANIIE